MAAFLSIAFSHMEKPTHVWLFDENRRVYGEDHSAPIWREHWVKREITGETSRSWIVAIAGQERKIPKKGDHRGVAWSEAEVNRKAWIKDHRHRITRAIEHLSTDDLIAVARLIGYKPAPPMETEVAP